MKFATVSLASSPKSSCSGQRIEAVNVVQIPVAIPFIPGRGYYYDDDFHPEPPKGYHAAGSSNQADPPKNGKPGHHKSN